ncbi:MAG: UbiA family prenyltransferase [Thermoguttaceae bacterium]|nr:UbiA family prenyltransferase [Thermoguttaceae bacterium]
MKRTTNESEKSEKTENSTQTAPARPSAVGAWVLAARPKTLSAAFVPVLVGVSLGAADLAARGAVDSFSVLAAFCCCGFALLAQIAANFANDYSDYKKGADGEERKGPARAVASGWISPRAMAVGTFVALAAD